MKIRGIRLSITRLLKFFIFTLIFTLSFILSSCATTKNISTAKDINVNKYMGKWYVSASLHPIFKQQCEYMTVDYKHPSDNNIEITNSCHLGNKVISKDTQTWVYDTDNNSKFWRPFSGGYWVLYVSRDYQFAAVGKPSKDYLLFLSRDKVISSKQLAIMKNIAAKSGYNVADIKVTPHIMNL